LKLHVSGGVFGIISAYAPHNLKPLSERFQFFSALDGAYRHCSANVGKIIFGDLNSRIGSKRAGEEDFVGAFTFGRAAVHQVEVPNRDLLLETCTSNELCVANTFIPGGPEEKETFLEPGTSWMGPVTEHGHNMLDLMLCSQMVMAKVEQLLSIRSAALATDHYLVKSVIRMERPEKNTKETFSSQCALFIGC